MNKEEFFKKWIDAFIPNLSKSQYVKHIKRGFLWHVFSFELIEKNRFLSGNQAREEYNKQNKREAVVFSLWGQKEESEVMNKSFDSAEKLDQLPETYVLAKDASWTYLSTHEHSLDLGPYFMKK